MEKRINKKKGNENISAKKVKATDKNLPLKKRTEQDQKILEIAQNFSELRTTPILIPPPQYQQDEENHKKDTKQKAPKKQKVQLLKVKYVIPVGDNIIMEYKLPQDEIMKIRKTNIQFIRNPRIEVRHTKSTVLKEEFSSYCGIRHRHTTWLYYI